MRVGIVGCGIRGQLFASALKHVDGVTVAGMSDPSRAARDSAAKSLGKTLDLFSHHDELYNKNLDAVVIATPDFAHREASVSAARQGIHLMIEKPLATSSEDAIAISRAVEEGGGSCLVAFENRWNPHFLKLKSLIDNGDLGSIVSVRGVLSNTYFVPEQMLSWSPSSSPAWFLMPHTLDLAMWLADSTPSDATAYGHRGVLSSRGIDTWDQIDALIRLESGTIVNLTSSWILPESSPHIVDFRVEVVGTLGSAHINMNDQGIQTHANKYATHWPLPVEINDVEHGMAQWMVRSWARSISRNEPIKPDVHHGLIVTRTIEEIHRTI